MAKFAEYYLRFKHDFAPYNWENRQNHLSDIFSGKEKFIIGEGTPSEEQKARGISHARTFHHRIHHLESVPEIIIIQIANSIDIAMEINYEKTVVKNEPSCFVIIDNRKGMRTIAIQNRRKAFPAPKRVADILASTLSEALFSKYCYQLEILPAFYPEDLLQAWHKLERHVQAMKFPTTTEMTEDEIRRRAKEAISQSNNNCNFDDSLFTHILCMIKAAKEAKYNQNITVSRENREAIYVDLTTKYMKNMLTYARATNSPVELVTTDGASFKCFVESDEENTDKIIHKELDTQLLEMLFRGKKHTGEKASKEDIEKAEEKIIEMLNSMKHYSSADQETEVVC